MSRTFVLSRGLWPPALAAALAVAAAVAVALTFAPRASADFSTAQCDGSDITGQGASFAGEAHQVFRQRFEFAFCPGGTAPAVDYRALGSGDGLRSMGVRTGANADGSQARSQDTRFGMSDDPPTPTQESQMETGTDTPGDESEVHVVPAAVGAVAPLVNFPDGCDPTDLAPNDRTDAPGTDDDNLVRVRFNKTKFEGAWASAAGFRTWRQVFPQLADTPACNKPIIRVVRFDRSGTTFAFKDYLNEINPTRGWLTTFASADNRQWPAATFGRPSHCGPTTDAPGRDDDAADQLTSACANGNQNLVPKLIATDGSIGYSDIATARTAGLEMVPGGDADNDKYWTQAQNGSVTTANSNTASGFTEPTADPNGFRTDGASGSNCGQATFNNTPSSTLGDWSQTSGVNSPAGYGVCTFTYGLLFDDYAKAYALIGNGAAEEQKARTVKDYWTSNVSEGGQAVLFDRDYSPLPGNIQAIAQAGVAAVNFNKSGTAGGGGGGGATTPGGNPVGNNNPGGGGTGGGATTPPSNLFSVPRRSINSRNGTVVFTTRLPGAGVLQLNGTAKKPAAKRNKRRSRRGSGSQAGRQITVGRVRLTVSRAGTYRVTLKPGSAAKRILRQRRKLKTVVRLTYTPRGGTAATTRRTVTLQLRKPAAKKRGNQRG